MATSLEEIFRITPEQILGEEEGGHELEDLENFVKYLEHICDVICHH